MIGSSAFSDPLMVLPFGRYTCLVEGSPVHGSAMVSVAKCDVAPESISSVPVCFLRLGCRWLMMRVPSCC